MLIATITALVIIFGGGGGLEHYLLNIKKPAKAAVEDKATVKALVEESKALGNALKTHNGDRAELEAAFLDFHVRQDVASAEWKAQIDRIIDVCEAAQKDILDARDAMRVQVSDDEWRDIFAGTVPASDTGSKLEEK